MLGCCGETVSCLFLLFWVNLYSYQHILIGGGQCEWEGCGRYVGQVNMRREDRGGREGGRVGEYDIELQS